MQSSRLSWWARVTMSAYSRRTAGMGTEAGTVRLAQLLTRTLLTLQSSTFICRVTLDKHRHFATDERSTDTISSGYIRCKAHLVPHTTTCCTTRTNSPPTRCRLFPSPSVTYTPAVRARSRSLHLSTVSAVVLFIQKVSSRTRRHLTMFPFPNRCSSRVYTREEPLRPGGKIRPY